MKVLIVDDSAVTRLLIRRALEQHRPDAPVDVVEAQNGEEALSAVQASAFDLVLLDWNMPVLDGLSFVKRVRNDGMQAPIIMVTAVTDENLVYEACAAGVSDYIEKPLRPSELYERIKDHLS
jgi:two-component system chemotaxis response regulator CheY